MYTYNLKKALLAIDANTWLRFGLLLAFALCWSQGVYAADEDLPGVGILDWVISILTGKLARGFAAIVVIGAGYMGWVGRLGWHIAANIIGGTILVFGGATIAEKFIGAAGAV